VDCQTQGRLTFMIELYFNEKSVINSKYVRWPAKKFSHNLNVSVIKALITHLDFDVTEK
jgi:hypothetical protein